MKFRGTLLALLILVVAGMLSSCTKREDLTLAEFQDRSITIAEFERAYQRVDPIFLPKATGIEGRREFLTTMLNKEVMSFKADQLGYDKDPAVVQGMEAYLKMGLQAGYLKRRVVDEVTVTEAEVKEHHRNLGATVSIKQILCDTPDEAETVYQLIEDGADFDSILREHSKGADAPNGGNIMTMTYGQFSPGLQRRVFALKVGEFTEPIISPYGWFIIKVVRRTDGRDQRDYTENFATLEQEVRVMNEMEKSQELTDRLRDEYGVKWYTDGMRVVFNALPPDRPLTSPPRRQDEVYPLLYFDEVDLAKPVVEFKGQMITVRDISDYYDQSSFFNRPRREFRLGGIRTFMMERIMNQIVPEEMAKSKIEEDPEVAAAIKGKREELMVNRLWDDMVNKQTVATRDEIERYYQENPGLFVVPEKRRFGVILVGDETAASEAFKEIKNGELFRNVAMAYSIDEDTRKKLAETELLSEGEQPEMDRVGFELARVGAVSEPFETARGWMILKLTEREDERKYTLDEASGSIEGVIKQNKNEERLKELLDKWKDELGVVIHDKRLEKIDVQERSATPEATASRG